MLPDFIQHTRGNASIWIDRKLADPAFVNRLADADQLFREPTCQIIKDQKKIKVGRLTVQIAGSPRAIYIKRYNAFSLRFKLASPFVHSGAFRALQGAAILHEAKVPTAVPVAAVENRVRRALTKSFFISEEIVSGKTVDAYWHDELKTLNGRQGFELRRRFLAGLAQLFYALHAQDIYHNDLKDANILAVAKGLEKSASFFLLDLEGVRQYSPLSERRRLKNLVQLHRTLGRYLRRTDKLIFLKGYLGPLFSQQRVRRRLIENVLRESKRLDGTKAVRMGGNVVSERTRHG